MSNRNAEKWTAWLASQSGIGIIDGMSSSKIVTRFAPSPTGYLHVGGARTALFNWLLARNTGGAFLLRIEDTDLARSTEDAVRQLVEDLSWLGLKWDNPELVYQSKRLAIYNKIIDQLIAEGKAYEAWETNEELTALRDAATAKKKSFKYVKPNYTAEQIKQYHDEGRKAVVRLVMPVKEYRFFDVGLGKEVVQSPYEVQDFVIRKTDGMPTYHFGVVVDDAEMGVTHVLRGLEHLLNTVNHIALQEALGYPRPVYAHLSVMLNPETGEKLSKRDRDRRIRKRTQELLRTSKKSVGEVAAATGLSEQRLADWLATDTMQLDLTEQPRVMAWCGLKESDLPEVMIHDFRKNGYTPEVLLNFLALQGWSPGGDKEQMSIEEMVSLFSIDRVISSNPKFNRDKLKSFSTDFFAKASIERQLAALKDFLVVNDSPLRLASDEQLVTILKMNHGYRVMSEVNEKSAFLLAPAESIVYAARDVEKILLKDDKQGVKALVALRAALGEAKWESAELESAMAGVCTQTGLQLGKIAQPLRVALSGTGVSPPIYDCLLFLGREASLARIDRCIAAHSA
jgi:glutamyl/glutaminyl-tRNA synthetase